MNILLAFEDLQSVAKAHQELSATFSNASVMMERNQSGRDSYDIFITMQTKMNEADILSMIMPTVDKYGGVYVASGELTHTPYDMILLVSGVSLPEHIIEVRKLVNGNIPMCFFTAEEQYLIRFLLAQREAELSLKSQ